MLTIIQDMIKSNSGISSVRGINLLGATIASLILLFDTIVNSSVRAETFAIYLAYCGGVYSYGKKLDKEKVNEKVN